MKPRLTIETIAERLSAVTDTVLVSTEYKNNRTPLRFRCSCGQEFERTWNNLYDSKAFKCFKCATQEEYQDKRESLESVKERIRAVGCQYISGEFKNQKSVITILCKCGHTRKMIYNSIVNQAFSGLCKNCAKKQQGQSQAFNIAEVACVAWDIYGVELLSEEYINSHEPLRFRCSCGKEFTANWNNLQSGQTRCAKCSGALSKGEFAIKNWLERSGIPYEQQKTFPGCGNKKPYRFDFYIPDYNLCIEFDGEQHYLERSYFNKFDRAPIKARDAEKDAYCTECGIELLRIPYTKIKNIDDILKDKLIPR